MSIKRIWLILVVLIWGCAPKFNEQKDFGGFTGRINLNQEKITVHHFTSLDSDSQSHFSDSNSVLNDISHFEKSHSYAIKKHAVSQKNYKSSLKYEKSNRVTRNQNNFFPGNRSGFIHWEYLIVGISLIIGGIVFLIKNPISNSTFTNGILSFFILFVALGCIFLGIAMPYIGQQAEQWVKRRSLLTKLGVIMTPLFALSLINEALGTIGTLGLLLLLIGLIVDFFRNGDHLFKRKKSNNKIWKRLGTFLKFGLIGLLILSLIAILVFA